MTRPRTTAVSRVLRRALARARRVTWVQRSPFDEDECCLGTAVAWQLAITPRSRRNIGLALEQLARTIGLSSVADIPPWNDHPLRKRAHVEHVLKVTIARVEREAAGG